MASRITLAFSVGSHDPDAPELVDLIISEFDQFATHQNSAAALPDPGCGGFPHHAGTLARILERPDQRLHDIVADRNGFWLAPERMFQRGHDCDAKIQSLDTLRRPVGGDFVAGHAPHFLGVGLEENLKQALAELIANPVVEAAGRRDRECLGIGIGQHAGDAGEYPEIAQRLERAQRIGIEFSAVIDPR